MSRKSDHLRRLGQYKKFYMEVNPGEHHFTACFLLPRLIEIFSSKTLLYINPDGMKGRSELKGKPILGDLIWGDGSNGKYKISHQIEVKIKMGGGVTFGNLTKTQIKGLKGKSTHESAFKKLLYIFAREQGIVVVTAKTLRASIAASHVAITPKSDDRYFSLNLEAFLSNRSQYWDIYKKHFIKWEDDNTDRLFEMIETALG